MAARRNTQTPVLDVEVPDEIELDLDGSIDMSDDENVDDAELADAEDEVKAPTRKYFSHANCDHARQGEAGKIARAACRKAIRAWVAAEAEFLNEVQVAV